MPTRTVPILHFVAAVGLICPAVISAGSVARGQDNAALPGPSVGKTAVLQNDRLALVFDRKKGTLQSIENRLAGETYQVQDDEFQVEAVEFRLDFTNTTLVSVESQANGVKARYQGEGMTIEATYTLRGENAFVEKQLVLTSSRDCGLKQVVVSRPTFSAADLRIVDYRHPQLGLNKGAEPAHTYFGRTAKGGLFTGMEMYFDASSTKGQQVVLAYLPNLTVKANEKVICEPVYLGVYRKNGQENEKDGSPISSESKAMVAMTSALLPPQNERIGPMMCGWWSEGFRGQYKTRADVEHDMRSIDFAVECGIDIVSDAKTWAGDWQEVGDLRNDARLQLRERPLELAEYARKKGVRWLFWPTMGNTNPWSEGQPGKPFRASDKPEWRVPGHPAACFAYPPFHDWLLKTMLDAMEAGRYGAWGMDGDFFGEPGFGGSPGYNGGPGPHGEPAEPWVHPAQCRSKVHDHLSPDINYICQKNLTEMARVLRQRYPNLYMLHYRPAMDLGVWALRHVDASFTVNEWASLEGIPGMGPQPKNVLLGDKIRYWSRIRVHKHFFPHYLDSPLVFDAPKSMSKRDWTSEKIDYIMLSALSSSPNQTYYLPSQAGIPAADKQVIKKWLDWGRTNIAHLMVRKDLPDWPTAGKVDGSAHIVGQRGFVFLFNPNKDALQGTFALSEESIGLKGDSAFRVSQFYPTAKRMAAARYGETIRWDIPGRTVVILDIRPTP